MDSLLNFNHGYRMSRSHDILDILPPPRPTVVPESSASMVIHQDVSLNRIRLRLEVSKDMPTFNGQSDPLAWLDQARVRLIFAEIRSFPEQLLILESRLRSPLNIWFRHLPRPDKESRDALKQH